MRSNDSGVWFEAKARSFKLIPKIGLIDVFFRRVGSIAATCGYAFIPLCGRTTLIFRPLFIF